MCFEHGTAVTIDLAHGFQEHGGFSSSLFTNDQIVMTATSARHDVINSGLLVPNNPVLFITVMVFPRNYTRDLKSRITRLECIVHFIQDQILVVLVVGISRH